MRRWSNWLTSKDLIFWEQQRTRQNKRSRSKEKQQAITPSENKQLEVHQVQEIKLPPMLKDRVEEEQKGSVAKF